MTYLTYALSLLVEHRQKTTCLRLLLSAATSFFSPAAIFSSSSQHVSMPVYTGALFYFQVIIIIIMKMYIVQKYTKNEKYAATLRNTLCM